MNDITNENNALSFLMDNGYSLEEIEQCIKDGLTFEEMAGAVRAKLARGEAPGVQLKFFEGKKFLHNVMGDYLIKNHGVCKINGTIHVYIDGIYKQGEDFLHGQMIKLIPTISDARRKEVYKYIKASLDTPTRTVAPPELIPFKSRIYDLENDRFIDCSPEYVFLNRFPYDYRPDAPDCPLILDTIKQIAADDGEVFDLICEVFGSCFYRLNRYRGAVMLYGPNGSGGKSTLLNILTQLVGRENTSFLSLQDTAARFRIAEIYGKAVNIGDDIPGTYLPDGDVFKRLVTGDPITAEKKGQDAFSFEPYAKMFFSMNELPGLGDKSKAMFSRILLIPLNQDFSKAGTRNTSLRHRVWTTEEMECLLKYAIQGLKRLKAQEGFTRPQCVIQATARYEIENDPVRSYLAENPDIINEPTLKVYRDYNYWCQDRGLKPVSHTKFSREVCNIRNLTTATKRVNYMDKALNRCFVREKYNGDSDFPF